MKKVFKYILALVCCVCIITAAFCFFVSKSDADYTEADLSKGSLVLINNDYRLPSDYAPELTTLSNGERVASSMYPHLQKMFDDMRKQSVFPFVRSGYRSHEQQQNILENKIAQYIKEGLSPKSAKESALDWVAKPGASEHQSGLAVDINYVEGKSSPAMVYGWLNENAHKYGFILRYPKDKTDITGISNEPWHYRYVGKKAATEMYKQGLCLEEYLSSNSQ